jgi:toxin ParE1/3/4
MRIAYSKRALADIRRIAAETNRVFGEKVAESLGGRIRATIEQLSREPYSGHELRQKSDVYVFTLVRYPFRIFYRVFNGGIRIQQFGTPRGDHGKASALND